jgi:hypothetical protein
MANEESKLSPKGLEALRTVRALRRMAPTGATVAAEKHATKQLSVADITQIALILAQEEEHNDQR